MKCFVRALLCVVVLSLAACGGGDASVTVGLKSLSSGIVSRSEGFARLDRLLTAPFGAGDYGAAAVGAGGLSSYKLYISSISLCESIETTAGSTAFDNPKNCATIYENNADNYDSYDVATAKAETAANKYFDILSATDRDALTKTVTVGAGTYNVGLIQWYKPIKFTVDVATQNGQHMYSKTSAAADGTITSGMDTGPAEEMTADLNNGGTWFKMLQPFTVAAGDTVSVDLAFDLEQKFFGGQSVSNGLAKQTSSCGSIGYCGIYAPILRLSPVPRKAGESTMVETYEMEPTGLTEWKLRVDVYYNSADSTKAILAADVFPIPTAATASSVAAGVYVYSVEESGGVTTFKGYDGSAQLTFTRGASGSGTVTCPSGATLAGCSGTNAVTWTTRTVRTL